MLRLSSYPILLLLLVLVHFADPVLGLVPPAKYGAVTPSLLQRQTPTYYSRTLTRVHFFGRNKKNDDSTAADQQTTSENSNNNSKDNNDKDESKTATSEKSKQGNSLLPFFARFGSKTVTNTETTATAETESSNDMPKQNDDKPIIVAPATVTIAKPVDEFENLSPTERAKLLRAQAERARLEAERMDAELTLSKITKLEKDIATAKAKDKDVQELQREMQVLQAKIKGEPLPRPVPPKATAKLATPTTLPVTTVKKTESKQTAKLSAIDNTKSAFATKSERVSAILEKFSPLTPPSEDMMNIKYSSTVYPDPTDPDLAEFDTDMIRAAFKFLPAFMKQELTVAFDDPKNDTAVADQLDKAMRYDVNYKTPRPSFTIDEINAGAERLRNNKNLQQSLPTSFISASLSNATELVLLSLEYEQMAKFRFLDAKGQLFSLESMASDSNDMDIFMQLTNKTEVDIFVETLYPKCTRKEGKAPTEAQIKKFAADILPNTPFSAVSKPEPVDGGYYIRGFNKAKDGNELIAKIDEQLEKSSLKDKMTVLYTKDFSAFADWDEEAFFSVITDDDAPRVLYIIGKDVTREPRRVLLSITSAFGIATTWYLSLYPFLLNSEIAKRVDEQVALADANMNPDLSWLSDLSFPLFVTFISINLMHELGHFLVASTKGFKITAPTWVPSFITGITSSVTTFKTLPKNNQDMFDFSVAGPLTGMLASVVAIAVGSQLSLSSDPSMFPALPLEILRQSTLGGGIIEAVLGNGALSIPAGAQGSAAVAGINIALHPIAIAGYIGLIVNALCMIPIGTTDGGRIALALFGRVSKLSVGNIFFLALLFVGILGSDLFLFYFAFCIAFQTNNEVPARNEVDQVDFSRVIVATAAYVIALLAIIPFQ